MTALELCPAHRPTTFLRLNSLTSCGRREFVRLRLPCCPNSLPPQAITAPTLRLARQCVSPHRSSSTSTCLGCPFSSLIEQFERSSILLTSETWDMTPVPSWPCRLRPTLQISVSPLVLLFPEITVNCSPPASCFTSKFYMFLVIRIGVELQSSGLSGLENSRYCDSCMLALLPHPSTPPDSSTASECSAPQAIIFTLEAIPFTCEGNLTLRSGKGCARCSFVPHCPQLSSPIANTWPSPVRHKKWSFPVAMSFTSFRTSTFRAVGFTYAFPDYLVTAHWNTSPETVSANMQPFVKPTLSTLSARLS